MPNQDLLQQGMSQAGFENKAWGCLQKGVRPKKSESEGGEEGEEGGREDQGGQLLHRSGEQSCKKRKN